MALSAAIEPRWTARSRLLEYASRSRIFVAAFLLICLPFVTPYTSLATSMAIFGLYAIGFDLAYGQAGMLSLGHAAFFGGGAFGCGIAIADFGWPWWIAVPCGVLVATVLAALIGSLAVRSRGVTLAMITWALATCVYYAFYKATALTGGENGLRGVNVDEASFGLAVVNLRDPLQRYYFIAAFVLLGLAAVSRLLNSPFGTALNAIRENEARATAVGYDVKGSLLLAMILSGALCGLAGSLYAINLTVVPSSVLQYKVSGDALIMSILGGSGSFFGPLIGAAIFVLFSDQLAVVTNHWELYLGALFMVCIGIFPGGVGGTIQRWILK